MGIPKGATLPSHIYLVSCLYFLLTALQTANDEYSSKLQSGSAQDKTLFDLGWTVDDLSRLSESGRTLLVEIIAVKELLEDDTTDLVTSNVAKRLTQVHQRLLNFVKGMFV